MTDAFSKTDFDIVIVGGGIIGATLAALLGNEASELRIALVDGGRLPEMNLAEFDPRVVALSKASEALYRKLGVWESVFEHRACPYFDMHVWDGDGTADIHFSSGDIHQSNLGHIVENSVLISMLHKKIAELPSIETQFNIKVSSFSRESNQSCIGLDNGQLLMASLVVAADGAHSYLRDLADFSVRDWDYGHSAIVTTVEVENAHQHTAWQRFSSDGPLAFLPLSRDGKEQRHCSIVWSIKHALVEKMMALDDAQFCDALGSAFERHLGNIIKTDKRFSFPLRQRHAKHYVSPGLVLVGDAAHTIHPLAGQGANLGIYDVDTLSQEVFRAIKRGVPLHDESIIKRYERQRQPHNLLAMSAMEGFKRLFGTDDLVWRWLRNEGLRTVNGLPWLKNQLTKIASGYI